MRLKNIKGAHEVVCNSKFVINDPTLHKGKWKELFLNKENPIYIEIGMGRGNFIINNAITFPNINFIGIEMYDSVIYKAIKKLELLEEEPQNLKLIRMDATTISDVFENEVSRIYLNFSDPWPKSKHEDRRLTSKRFLDRYDSIFIKGSTKEIFQKTDNIDLFNFSKQSFEDKGYTLKNVTNDLHNSNLALTNIKTEYEEKFLKDGVKINYLEAYKF